ncbi:hypothetical protein PF005_g9500 [Phytophthora fragariae]|uniref:Uncharacterized protein n=1 Tax=Phytophthora fragariae TaxID=53985 RepID=A0A6A3ZRA2_9STRA|nr:hypothetical protein PF003_g12609 [Phytophthora fragariae]KAE8940069.1 hypothetical protein PF009_g10109 [Phytophthora fragariae]KAE9013618.1 hypothetical protein PF011_g8409 [Phytophthora fragariae]KAE9116554.1 hypothetical protein PF007_g9629 [Phytophthora fragariae]KAE9117652.1 hypothetical protein PF010_g8532 [Phytophthora fragariae]
MKLDLKEGDLFNEDEIEQMKLCKQIEKNNAGLEGQCWRQCWQQALRQNRADRIEPKNSIPG